MNALDSTFKFNFEMMIDGSKLFHRLFRHKSAKRNSNNSSQSNNNNQDNNSKWGKSRKTIWYIILENIWFLIPLSTQNTRSHFCFVFCRSSSKRELIILGNVAQICSGKLQSVWPDLAKYSQFGEFEKTSAIFWQNFELLLRFLCYWAKFDCCKLPNTAQIIWSHWS